MTVITILPDVTVELLAFQGSDESIADAARVSNIGEPDRKRDRGLINVLMEKKHGSPFEHTFLKFYVKAPIFVFREFHRHRAGFSYNEMSGRYTTLLPEFYVPARNRPLVNAGSKMRPNFVLGNEAQFLEMDNTLYQTYQIAWNAYEDLLERKVANEVARAVLPVGIMSQMQVSCNVRSLLHFLSLRTDDSRATFPSKPQYEIQMVALKMEESLASLFPVVYEAYNNHGRVAP